MRSRDVQRVSVLALMAVLLFGLSHEVRRSVEVRSGFVIQVDQLSTTALPEGLSPRVSESVARLPLPARATAFDRHLVPFAAACLGDLPWVERVDTVQLLPPNRLTFSVRTRLPVAQLGRSKDAPLLTHDGWVIPRKYADHPERLPRLQGAPPANRLLARKRAMRAAISVLDELGRLAGRVKVIDVSNLGGRKSSKESEVTLVLDGGLLVEWGRPSTSERSRIPGESKLAALEEFLDGCPELEDVERVSLRWDETTYLLRPADALASADAR